MAKNLVIVESPAKARSINRLLGSSFEVRASMGHVRDLPEKKLGVDIKNGFQPEYVVIPGRSKVLQDLRKIAGKADSIYLAPDPDREGEAIAWHLKEALADSATADRFLRVSYNEITADAIRAAFAAPGAIDNRRVDSQQARRILDRLVGYKVSPLLWRRVKGGSSAGRVQSVALRLVCERERAIEDFVPEEYWVLAVRLAKRADPRDPFIARLARVDGEKADIRNEETAKKVVANLDERDFRVSAVKTRDQQRKPRPPFITSTLQQAASSLMGFSPSRTMRLAQRLYEGLDDTGGLITYMRTDSVSVSKQAVEQCRQYVESSLGAQFLPDKPVRYRSRDSAQEAHEAIRPTDVSRTPEVLRGKLPEPEWKVYRLVWERFVASQMKPAVIRQRSVEIEAVASEGEPHYLFRSSTSEVIFKGYMQVTGVERGNKKDEKEEFVPPLQEDELLDCLECLKERKETKPPARYSEASLVRALEENGVGRPSTYAAILSTLFDRKYIERLKRTLQPTESGRRVNDFLVQHLDELFNVQFTARMERELDRIEEGEVEWTAMLREFYDSLLQWLEKAKGPPADREKVGRLLEALSQVEGWSPPVKNGKRTYSDEKFVASVRRQFDANEKPITERQYIALRKLAIRYRDQLADWGSLASVLNLDEAEAEQESPRDDTAAKLEALSRVEFDPPRESGKRTFDDGAFFASLRDQVSGGKRLSEKQLDVLNRLLDKYADQLGGPEAVAERFGIRTRDPREMEACGRIIEALRKVNEWNPPVKRGKRTYDDRAFFESLDKQLRERRSLSPRQVASLRKLAVKYADRIPNYEELTAYGLPKREEIKKSGSRGKRQGKS